MEVAVRPMDTGLQSWLKISFRLGGDFAAEMGVMGGDKNIPPPDVDGGVDERKSEEPEDDDGRLCSRFCGCDDISGMESLAKIPIGGVTIPLLSPSSISVSPIKPPYLSHSPRRLLKFVMWKLWFKRFLGRRGRNIMTQFLRAIG